MKFSIKLIITLACIALILLVVIYQFTGVFHMEPSLNKEQRTEFAWVLNTDQLTHKKSTLEDTPNFVAAYTDAGNQGLAIQIRTAGYSGSSSPIELLVGFDTTGAVMGVAVISHSETPGLGTRIEDPDYLAQFVGLTPTKQAVDTIAGATISSTAVNKGVAETFLIFDRIQGEVLS